MTRRTRKPQHSLEIVHLYAREMNIYGDRGNVLTLAKRLQWRGIEARVVEVGVGERYNLAHADIIFAGGGQDRGQVVVGEDLQRRSEQLHAAADDGVPMLTICGTYQLFGRRFRTLEGQDISGIGLFQAETVGSRRRMIGNLVIDGEWGRLVGFENHSGETWLDHGQAALGRVVKGYGNDVRGREEGAVYRNVFGCYLHGPVLPKNPAFADHLLLTALRRKYDIDRLEPLDDGLERAAAATAMTRPQ